MLQSKDIEELSGLESMGHTCAAYKTHFQTKELHTMKVKGWKQIFQANRHEKKSRGSNTQLEKK